MAEDLSGFSMLELFRLEAESQTAVLSAGVLAIEELERSPATVESMMRAAHSLKGAARIVGLDAAVGVAHALEDVFVAAGKGQFHVRPEHADLLLAAIDFLGSIAKADDALAADGPWPGRADGLVAALGDMLAGRTAPAIIPAVAPPAVHVSAAEAEATTTTVSAPPPEPDAEPARPVARPIENADRVVRVSADSLTRLVGLAGESLVETRQLRPFVDALLQLRSTQVDLADAVGGFDEKLKAADVPLPPPWSPCWPRSASGPTPA